MGGAVITSRLLLRLLPPMCWWLGCLVSNLAAQQAEDRAFAALERMQAVLVESSEGRMEFEAVDSSIVRGKLARRKYVGTISWKFPSIRWDYVESFLQDGELVAEVAFFWQLNCFVIEIWLTNR